MAITEPIRLGDMVVIDGHTGRVEEIRMSFALSGNEFIAYVRRRDVISPLVGMAVGVVPLPRPLPNVNYNFQIMSAEGLQITADDQGLSGVVYGANLA